MIYSQKIPGSDEKPQHRVRLTRPYLPGVHEVTQGQYRAVTGANPSDFTTTQQVARNCQDSVVTSCLGSSHKGSHQGTEVGTMPHHWPADTDFALWELDVHDRNCHTVGT